MQISICLTEQARMNKAIAMACMLDQSG